MLGADVTFIAREFPLPTTVGLTSFPYWAVQFLNPVSYLGYLYFLEGLPTSAGNSLATSLQQVGVPEGAMTFLAEHATVDVAHIKLMERYVDTLVRTERDLFDVSYAMRTTAKLYELMVAGAFEAADQGLAADDANLGEVMRLISSAELHAAA